ncbi:MAG: hypothetical protein ACRERE_42660 [Candidatus Entotheonellia bacterium]
MRSHPGWTLVSDFRDPAYRSLDRYELSFFDRPESQHGWGHDGGLPIPPERCTTVWLDPNNFRWLAE